MSIILKNSGAVSINLAGWRILSVTGGQSFTFNDFVLKPNSTVKVGDSDQNSDVDFHWLTGRGIWNNSKSDPAELYDSNNELVPKNSEGLKGKYNFITLRI